MLRLAREDGRTLVVVTRDPAVTARVDRAVSLTDGEIVDDRAV